MSEDVYCERCGKKMDGPATGIGHWCNDLECGSEALLEIRKNWEKEKQFTRSEVEALVFKALLMQIESTKEICREKQDCFDSDYINESLLSVSDVMGKDDDSN